VAWLERIPEEPAQEIVVALAGPAVNLVIAGVLYLVLGGLVPREGLEVDNPGVDLLARLLWANVFLVVFNLIPAFPMDDGRVLRAFLAHRLGYARGTQIAASVGQAVAFLLGLLGLMAPTRFWSSSPCSSTSPRRPRRTRRRCARFRAG
jgi:Zn-dependent protease